MTTVSKTLQQHRDAQEYTPHQSKKEPVATLKVRVPKSLKADFEKACGLFHMSPQDVVTRMLTTWVEDRKEWVDRNDGNPHFDTP